MLCLCTTTFVINASEKSITIKFEKTSKASTTVINDPAIFIETFVSEGADYLDGSIDKGAKLWFPAENAIKMGYSTYRGRFVLKLKDEYQAVPTKIVVNAKQSGSTGRMYARSSFMSAGKFSSDGLGLTDGSVTIPKTYTDISFPANYPITHKMEYLNIEAGPNVYIKSITIYFAEPKEIASCEALYNLTENNYYTFNIGIEGTRVSHTDTDTLLYARTVDPSANPSEPNRTSGFDSYEDRNWKEEFDQRDWFAIESDDLSLEGYEIKSGMFLYNGSKFIPIDAMEQNSMQKSINYNTYRPANLIHGGYTNYTEEGEYQAFYVKPKLNEIANFVGFVSEDMEFYYDNAHGRYNGRGIKIIEGKDSGLDTNPGDYILFSGIILKDEDETSCGYKIQLYERTGETTGVPKNINTNDETSIFAIDGRIMVRNAQIGVVNIFNSMGQLVKTSTIEESAEIEVPSGFYIVQTGNAKKIVLVK